MSLSVEYSFFGNGNWSIDGVGGSATNGGTFDNQVPDNAVIEVAYLYQTRYEVGAAEAVTFEGTNIGSSDFVSLGANGGFLEAHRADVTDIVRALVGDGVGTEALSVTDVTQNETDGLSLVIVYSHPDEQERSIILADGFSDSSGDTFSITFPDAIDTTITGFEALMSLGIGFGFQTNGGGQVSLVDIDGRRLTSSAGGQDDALGTGNGGLNTIGGEGDDPSNPVDPFAAPTNPRTDDELYDLAQGNGADPAPFLQNGATALNVVTSNPSNDDNVYFAGFNLTAEAIADSDENDRPDARNDNVSTNKGVALPAIDVLDNDVDADNDDLTIVSFDDSLLTGAIVQNADGTFSYTPTADFVGTDTFTYTVSDGELEDTATVTITVEDDGDVDPPDPVDPTGVRIVGNNQDNALAGGDGDDTIIGRDGADDIEAGEGNDRVFGGDGDDIVDAGNGRNLVNGGAGNDDLTGGDDRDRLNGGADNDVVDGGAGNDKLSGGDGQDTLLAGEGDDILRLGQGLKGDGDEDFIFVDTLNNGDDIVFGFEGGIDKIDLNGATASVSFAGDSTIVDIDGGGTLQLRNFSEADFNAVGGDIFDALIV